MKIPVAIVSVEKEVIELLLQFKEYTVIGIFDPIKADKILGIPVWGPDENYPAKSREQPGFKLIMALDPPALKKKLLGSIYKSEDFVPLYSPRARISPTAEIGPASILQDEVVILAAATIGAFCKLNHRATVHHDCKVGDYCTLAPGARLLGDVTLGEGVFVGAEAVILPHVKVGTHATIGAGAVVNRDVAAGETVVGVPAKGKALRT